jgi:hypothetical protein
MAGDGKLTGSRQAASHTHHAAARLGKARPAVYMMQAFWQEKIGRKRVAPVPGEVSF